METYYASPEMSTPEEIEINIQIATNNPVIDGLMDSMCGLMAVLDNNRQVIAMNRAMLNKLGIKNPEKHLGLRLGKILECTHADDMLAGCGTGKYCATCGAAIAMVTALGQNTPCERICSLNTKDDHGPVDLCFKVQAVPITIENKHFLILFMTDITQEQNWAALEKVFLHDISNIMTGLCGTAELISDSNNGNNLIQNICGLISRLKKEIDIQRMLISNRDMSFEPKLESIQTETLLKELQYTFIANTVSARKQFDIETPRNLPEIVSDYSILMRILINMCTNAFEATPPGGQVRFWMTQSQDRVAFNVWNAGLIPENIQRRIFQHHFSTKTGTGRGQGTFSMKMLGEQLLKGRVHFSSSPSAGTVFTLSLPA
jgi:K+-sensing histidine kinase KdpD